MPNIPALETIFTRCAYRNRAYPPIEFRMTQSHCIHLCCAIGVEAFALCPNYRTCALIAVMMAVEGEIHLAHACRRCHSQDTTAMPLCCSLPTTTKTSSYVTTMPLNCKTRTTTEASSRYSACVYSVTTLCVYSMTTICMHAV